MRTNHLQLLILFIVVFIFIDFGVAKRMDPISRGIGLLFVGYILGCAIMDDFIIPLMKTQGWKKYET